MTKNLMPVIVVNKKNTSIRDFKFKLIGGLWCISTMGSIDGSKGIVYRPGTQITVNKGE